MSASQRRGVAAFRRSPCRTSLSIVATVFISSAFEVHAQEDTTPPTILRVDVSPQRIDTSLGDQTVIGTVEFTDDLSGIDAFGFCAERPSGGFVTCCSGEHIVSGDALAGVLTCTFTFQEFREFGDYPLDLELRDRVGNATHLSTTDLATLGFPSFITNGPDEDGDGVSDDDDNCVSDWNPDQEDTDQDGVGDTCDPCTDIDGDGFGAPGHFSCSTGSGEPDCNDAAPTTYPGAPEVCDGYDNDCDGGIDNAPLCDTTCDGAEPIGEVVRLAGELGVATQPAVVWTGTEFGVAWLDGRNGATNVYFSRLDFQGQRIGEETRITDTSACLCGLSLVFNGSGFGLAWTDERDGDQEIYFVRLDAVGMRIGQDVRLTTATPDPEFVQRAGSSLVWTGTEYGLVWGDGRANSNWELYFLRLDDDGHVLGEEVRVTTLSGTSQGPALAWTGAEYGLAWYDTVAGRAQVYFTRLAPDGIPLVSPMLLSTTDEAYTPSLAWTGSEYGVAWTGPSWDPDLYLTRLGFQGANLSTTRLTDDPRSARDPQLAWTGSDYGLSWYDFSAPNLDLLFGTLDSLGTPHDPFSILNANGSESHSVAWTGEEFAVAWGSQGGELKFTRVQCHCVDFDNDGVSNCRDCDDTMESAFPGASQVCDGRNNDCDDPAWPAVPANEADADGDGYRSCEGDCDDTTGTVHPGAAQICDGLNNDCNDPTWPVAPAEDADRDADGLSSCVGDCNDSAIGTYPGAPEVCDGFDNDCDGSLDNESACLRGCPAPEKVAPEVVVSPGTPAYDPDLVSTGSGWAIVWSDGRFSDGTEVYFARLDPSGHLLEELRITTANEASNSPSLAWTGSEFGVAWFDRRDGNAIYFVRLDSSGNRIMAHDARVALAPSHPSEGSTVPVLVWNGIEYGVAWTDAREGHGEVYFARLDAFGAMIGQEVRVTSDAARSVLGDLIWTGTEYVLAWVDSRDGNKEIYVARLDMGGTPIGGPVRVTNDNASSSSPSLAYTGLEFGIAWADQRVDTQALFFARLSSDGTKIGPDILVRGGSIEAPNLVWTGSEYGLAWRDLQQDEVYFAGLDEEGARLTDYLRITTAPDISATPSLAWSGVDFGMGWYDFRARFSQAYFSRIKCECDDGDGDGTDECGDCDDTRATVFPGAMERCDGLNNDCAAPFWPEVPEDETDQDGDGLASCAGDCDDGDSGILPGAQELCDGIDNDCDGEIDNPDECPAATVLQNGDFSTGSVAPWLFFSNGVASFGVEGGVGRVAITAAGNNVQVFQTPLSLSGSTKYRLTFRGRVTAGSRRVAVRLFSHGAPFTGYVSDPGTGAATQHVGAADFSPLTQVFSYVIETTPGNKTDARLMFWFADEDQPGDVYYLDEIVLQPVTDGPCPEACDGLDNDCDGAVPIVESDLDGDGFRGCEGDCADGDAGRFPGAAEACNGLDDDCDGLVDEDAGGEDPDADGLHSACDNCPAGFNPSQLDTDSDGRGNACDNCVTVANPGQEDLDADLRGDACDNCPSTANTGQENADGDEFGDACDNCARLANKGQADLDSDGAGDGCDNCPDTFNPLQDDTDGDGPGDACENCPEAFNPSQTDLDDDFEGDACDLDDGVIYLLVADPSLVEWHEEVGYDAWNVYAGDLAVLRAGEPYTQVPGGLAWRVCESGIPWVTDPSTPPRGRGVFYLVTGVTSGVEGSLGTNSAGAERPNTSPCP